MDKNAIKKYAVWARTELIDRVSQKALQYGITEKHSEPASATAINGVVLSKEEMTQRKALLERIAKNGYKQVMEEVAYTWFNRFSALRFMEVNGYLPSRVRVFTDENNQFKPQIITEAINLELDGLNMEKVYALKDANDDEGLFKYLIIVQCNALSPIMPVMFQRIDDYTELLFPDNLLRDGSAVQLMIEWIPEEDWKDAVQIIGWLYQYYISELNEKVYDGTLSRSKISKELLPAATTIYTPDWAVHYMVENSLGRIWCTGHPNTAPKDKWKYYLDEANQDSSIHEQLDEIYRYYANIAPEQIRCIDPCAGSGHILAYMFDVLIHIYEAYGYTAREAVKSIVENNIYGLDIDERAAQLAYFSVMMKARQYDKRFFARKDEDGNPDVPQPHVYEIMESNGLDRTAIEHFVGGDKELKKAMDTLVTEMHDAKEYGSILNITQVDFAALYRRFDEVLSDISIFNITIERDLLPLVRIAEVMAQKYDIVVTNPPYLGSSRFSPALDKYVKDNYTDVKFDLSMVMYKHALEKMVKSQGQVAFITTTSWMYLSSFEKLRSYIQQIGAITSLVEFGTELFEGKVGHNPIVAWVTQKKKINYAMKVVRLVEYCYSRRDEKEPEYFNERNHYVAKQSYFSEIPGAPIAYWVSENFIKAFDNGISIDTISDFTGSQHKTADNEKFLRFWWEPNRNVIDNHEWIFYIKGGEYRKWYGNIDLIVDWRDSAKHFYTTNPTSNMIKEPYWFAEGITYTSLTSSVNGFRYLPAIGVFDIKGPSIVKVKHLEYCLGFFNTPVAMRYLKLLNPTITLQVKDVKNTPIIVDESKVALVSGIVQQNINISRLDWDSVETSWDFNEHPLVRISHDLWDATAVGASMHYYYGGHPKVSCPLELCYMLWQGECSERFKNLKANEEELNRIFIDIYGLQDELTPEVNDDDVTVRKADLKRDIKSLISYAVGCMFGRYSIYENGLIYAGGVWDYNKYEDAAWRAEGKPEPIDYYTGTHFMPDQDNIIPICDDDYFAEDMVGRFINWVEIVYGRETLEENLRFIADALGGKGNARDVIRNYFLNDFYDDHLKIYQKRPIYWLFDSGKKNGFKALIYMHRYQPDTIARMRTDYVHEQQSRYRTAIADLEQRISSASTSERVKLTKRLKTLQEQATEIQSYEEKIHHLADQYISIDLDDGVKVNYAKFQDVLAKIK